MYKEWSDLPFHIRTAVTSCPSEFEVSFFDKPYFEESLKVWGLPFKVSLSSANILVPPDSAWYVVIDAIYPFGEVKVYPAKQGGITTTFPHQDLNSITKKEIPWNLGKLCLDGPFNKKISLNSRDPFGKSEERLRWHIYRTIQWIKNAIDGTLLNNGDPFELPQYPSSSSTIQRPIVYDSNSKNSKKWHENDIFGKFEICEIESMSNFYVVSHFKRLNGEIIDTFQGRMAPNSVFENAGYWLLLPDYFVLPEWKVPVNWGEARESLKQIGLDLDQYLKTIASDCRGKAQAILLLGYRIPTIVGEVKEEIHWKAILLPRFNFVSAYGFRKNEIGMWAYDKRENLADTKRIDYSNSFNINQQRLLARGRLPDSVRLKKVAVLGVGALGSLILDSIVRTGISDVLLVDSDILSAGNITRHALTMTDVNKSKVEGMSNLLKQISPYVKVTTFNEDLPSDATKLEELLHEYEIIIDCTGSNEAIEVLSQVFWKVPKFFFSFSLNWGATSLYTFKTCSNKFPMETFFQELRPHLTNLETREGVIEGAGCWSPLFPGPHSSILLASCYCIKSLLSIDNIRFNEPEFEVRDISL